MWAQECLHGYLLPGGQSSNRIRLEEGEVHHSLEEGHGLLRVATLSQEVTLLDEQVWETEQSEPGETHAHFLNTAYICTHGDNMWRCLYRYALYEQNMSIIFYFYLLSMIKKALYFYTDSKERIGHQFVMKTKSEWKLLKRRWPLKSFQDWV